MQARLAWPPGVRDLPGRKRGHSLVEQALWLAPRYPTLLPGPQLSVKAYLTLLSHSGRLPEPPVPKPRGTPKLSER